MNYKLINSTKIPSEVLDFIIRYCCPKKLNKFRVYIKYFEDQFAGTAYTDENRISLRINKKLRLPMTCNHKQLYKFGYTDRSMLMTQDELLVSLIAHELRHLWQMRVSKQDFSKTTLFKFDFMGEEFEAMYKMEKDASDYSRKMLLKWRKFVKNKN